LAGDSTQWWKLATIISCGTLAGAVIPELVNEGVYLDGITARKRSRDFRSGGRRVAWYFVRLRRRNFSAYYLGLSMSA